MKSRHMTHKKALLFSPHALTSFLSSYKSPTCFCIPFGQTKHFLGYLLYILSKPAWYLFSWSLFSKIHYISSSWKESSDVWTLKTSKRFMWHTPRDVPPSMAFFPFHITQAFADLPWPKGIWDMESNARYFMLSHPGRKVNLFCLIVRALSIHWTYYAIFHGFQNGNTLHVKPNSQH